jgi:hypothetical protein
MNEIIGQIGAPCMSPLQDALMVLLLVNERLETELEYFYEMATHRAPRLQPSAEPTR